MLNQSILNKQGCLLLFVNGTKCLCGFEADDVIFHWLAHFRNEETHTVVYILSVKDCS